MTTKEGRMTGPALVDEQEPQGSDAVRGWSGRPFPEQAERLMLPDGRVLEDAVIWPGFCQDELGLDPNKLWAELLTIPTWPSTQEIPFRPAGDAPRWIPGEQSALRYRGRPVKRDKIWLQSDYAEGLRKYNYTGWQHRISYATQAIESVPSMRRLTERLNAGLVPSGHQPHSHWILTRYDNADDGIGFHSDKDPDFAVNSFFIVIKFGAPRPFAFRMRGAKQPFFSRTLSAGSAVFVRCKADGAANNLVQHGVPPLTAPVGASGSLVSRCITTQIPWETVHLEVRRRRGTPSSTTTSSTGGISPGGIP